MTVSAVRRLLTARRVAVMTPDVATLSSLAHILLNSRLVAGLLCVTAFAGGRSTSGQMAVLILLMALVLGLLLSWPAVGQVLVEHPAVIAIDVLLMHVGLLVIGVDTPFLYVVAGSAALAGLCLGGRGAQVFAPVFLCGWYAALAISPPSVDSDAALLRVVVVDPVLVQAVLFGGVAMRRLLLRTQHIERQLRDESSVAAHAQERARLAREMHDTVSKSLYGLAMIAETLPAWVDRDPVRAQSHARELASASRQAVAEARRILDVMRSDDLSLDLSHALSHLVGTWAARTSRCATVDADDDVELGPGARYELLAVLGEALENVDRHTDAGVGVAVRLRHDRAWAELSIEDSGAGFAVPDDLVVLHRLGHYGLVGMRERAARVGGSLTVTSSVAGTTVRLRAPAVIDLRTAEPSIQGAVT